MSRYYNANGGQRRSKTVKLALPQGKFDSLFVELVKISATHGKDIAAGVLAKLCEKYKISDQESEFLRSFFSERS